jgi:hypothetical protein
MIRLLPVTERRQHPPGINHRARDYVCRQKLRLRQRQRGSVCSNRLCSRTRKANASSTKVI